MKLFEFEVLDSPIEPLIIEALDNKESRVINTINPHSYVESKKDLEFKAALIESDVLIPDGSGFVLASRVLSGRPIRKVAGYDLFEKSMQLLNRRGGSVFFLGSMDKVLTLIKSRAQKDFPLVSVSCFSPPYKESFSEEDVARFAELIEEASPDVVFVGLTAPKQEKLIRRLQQKVPVSIYSGIGAVFDFYAGTVTRPGKFWVSLHMEWIIRFLGEPRRLWRRNLISTPIFLKDLMLEKWFGSKGE